MNNRYISIMFSENGTPEITYGDGCTPQDVAMAACSLIGTASHTNQGCSKLGKKESD